MIYNAYIHGLLCLAIEQENISLVESYRLINQLRLVKPFLKVMFNSLQYVLSGKQNKTTQRMDRMGYRLFKWSCNEHE